MCFCEKRKVALISSSCLSVFSSFSRCLTNSSAVAIPKKAIKESKTKYNALKNAVYLSALNLSANWCFFHCCWGSFLLSISAFLVTTVFAHPNYLVVDNHLSFLSFWGKSHHLHHRLGQKDLWMLCICKLKTVFSRMIHHYTF